MAAEPMSLATSGIGIPAVRTAAEYERIKRALDFLLALTILIALLPVCALIALAIRLDSRGPVFYRQVRIGEGGRPFTLVKFRSMRANADSAPHEMFVRRLLTQPEATTTGAVYKIAQDSRITKVGAVLRRASLDELPQLWNVLQGEMSLVGPRPDVPYAVSEYAPWMRERLLAKPGITGLWQVSGRSRLSLRQMYELDRTYVSEASLALDLRILARTVPAVLGRVGAA